MSSLYGEGIHQVRCGPLKLTVPTSLTLRQKARRHVTQPIRLTRFKGSFNITNKGNDLVTFKVMSKTSKYLQVKPAHGLIESKQSIRIDVFAKDSLFFGNRITNFGLLILATACKVTNLSYLPEEIPLFWKDLILDGSCSFVDTFRIQRFQFIDMYGMPHDLYAESNFSDHSDIDGYLSSSSYSSQYCSDSEPEDRRGVNASEPFGNRRKLSETTVEEMNDLTKNMEETNNKLRDWTRVLIMFVILIILSLLQRSLGSLEVEIVLTQKRK